MNKLAKLEYGTKPARNGHSPFGIALVSLAGAIYLFTTLAAFTPITLFESAGNEKETKVAIVAAILGILLAVRAFQDSRRKTLLATFGLVLNGLAIPAAMIFLPYI
jgi:hypothetical protein